MSRNTTPKNNTQTFALVKTALQYLPAYSDGKFVDDLSDISATMFKDRGVVCECTGSGRSKHIFNNKYSFKNSHCKSARHKSYLANLSKNSDHILKTSILRRDEIRRLKIECGKIDQLNTQLSRKLTSSNNLLERKTEEVDELNALLEQQTEYHKESVKKEVANGIKKKVAEHSQILQDKELQLTEMTNKVKAMDLIWHNLGKALGYDIEITSDN